MKWTIGICTDGSQDSRIDKIIDSVEKNGIPADDHEIIVIGGDSKVERSNTRVIPFDETFKSGWITRKKNIIAHEAKFANLLIIHDYISILPEWYSSFESFGDDWDVAMCKISQQNGLRFRDWVTWQPHLGERIIRLLPYDDSSLMREMYVSGSLMIVKKEFLIRHPLNDRKTWGQSEDVEWSLSVRNIWNYKMNPGAIAKLLKPKDPWPITDERILYD